MSPDHGLPDSFLTNAFLDQLRRRNDVPAGLLGAVASLRQTVSDQARFINQLFPEYTPHDETYHLKRLFLVADTLLGEEVIKRMRFAELLVLATSLYAHDWGMAVSRHERDLIIAGEPAERFTSEGLVPLEGEQELFGSFVREVRLTVPAVREKGLPDELWREYVRQTHAQRSAARCRAFLAHIDTGLAEAVARVCVGHWSDITALSDHRMYPVDFALLRENVNLRAITVYARLIDLFDIGQDRTPYVIWKFVAPRDPVSRLEWAKHRALQPITCPAYMAGRVILVDGSTNDFEVYAALEDLRLYCDDQLRGATDLLAQMHDPRHRLDIYHLEWRVATAGFEPVSIRFEFERNSILQLLGDEIYQGDQHVFLRELLQNSIDAIRMRKEVLEKHGINAPALGVVRVHVERFENGDSVVTWQDDGIGMDLYVVQNFLSVAGRSYYRSEDFLRESLRMDPISRFGVGILSCFMSATKVEITTRREPYAATKCPLLRISIPAIDKQFRVEVVSDSGTVVGTTVKVFLDGARIRSQLKSGPYLHVAQYIEAVAGFVEFPICIEEDGRRIVRVHPSCPDEDVRTRFGPDYEISRLRVGYEWDSVFLPQSRAEARQVLREEQFVIGEAPLTHGYEGVLSYPVPRNSNDIVLQDFVSDIDEEGATITAGDGQPQATVRWFGRYSWPHRTESSESSLESRSAEARPALRVYRDGILLPHAQDPQEGAPWRAPLPGSRLVVNLPKSAARTIDLGRTRILGQDDHWYEPIAQTHREAAATRYGDAIRALEAVERLAALGAVSVRERLSGSALAAVLDYSDWPVPFLTSRGVFEFRHWDEVCSCAIWRLPEDFLYIAEKALMTVALDDEQKSVMRGWRGPDVLVALERGRSTHAYVRRALEELHNLITETHHLDGIALTEGIRNETVLSLEHLSPRRPLKAVDRGHVLRIAVSDPVSLSSAELESALDWKWRGFLLPIIAPSTDGDASWFSCHKYVNLLHPAGQLLVRMVAWIELAPSKNIDEALVGRAKDAVTPLGRLGLLFNSAIASVEAMARTAAEIGLIAEADILEFVPQPEAVLGDTDVSAVERTHGARIREFGGPRPGR